MPKNYYIILGIPANSSHSDIKSAYRKLAKEYHPDYYGQSKSPFLAIHEAYSVLGDPSRRKQYDDNLNTLRVKGMQKSDSSRGFEMASAEPLVPDQSWAEPLTPETASVSRTAASGIDSIFSQFFNTASLNWDYNRGSSDYGEVEVLLTGEQARRGGHIRVLLPAQIHCPSCQGWASSGMQECWHCFGAGYLRGEVPLLLNYPPGIVDNHVVELPLARYGFSGNLLKVRFRLTELSI